MSLQQILTVSQPLVHSILHPHATTLALVTGTGNSIALATVHGIDTAPPDTQQNSVLLRQMWPAIVGWNSHCETCSSSCS